VIQGLASDRGLYFPETITPLAPTFFDTIENLSNEEIAYQAIQQFVGDEIPEITLRTIIKDTLCFDFPLIEVEKVFFLLNYFMVQQWHSRMLAHDSCHVVWGISIKISKTVKYGSCCYWEIQAALLQAVSWRKRRRSDHTVSVW
jgi:hypothetical protein